MYRDGIIFAQDKSQQKKKNLPKKKLNSKYDTNATKGAKKSKKSGNMSIYKIGASKTPEGIELSKSWAQLGLEVNLVQRCQIFRMFKPTPIQCDVIPAILSGRDAVGWAQTGSGKTA
ncbi:MAG: hypothetical protein EZS28_047437, partial [Streblomastix strix]